MTLRDLLTALEEQGAAEHERALQDRRRQAAAIIADARERGNRIRDDALAAAEVAAGAQAQSLLAAARSDARQATRTAREGALEEVRATARTRLLDLPGSAAGADAARACMEEAVAALPKCTKVRVHPADAPRLRPGRSVEMVADLGTGGAIAEDDDGRYIDNTYLTRLSNVWPELRVGLSRSWDQS